KLRLWKATEKELEDYMADVFVPTVADIGRINGTLSEHRDDYAATFGKIRSLVVAHAIERKQEVIDQYYNATVIGRAFELFKALHDALKALHNDLWLNGRKPVLGAYTFDLPERTARMTREAI